MSRKPREYTFTDANGIDVTIESVGEYRDGRRDLVARLSDGGDGEWYREFIEADGGTADEVLGWLASRGVRFESIHSAAYNLKYVQGVMLDGDDTEEGLLARAREWTDEYCRMVLPPEVLEAVGRP